MSADVYVAVLRHTPALYPAADWNVRDATLNDEARTDNVCEYWNRAYSSLVSESHPSVWKTIRNLRKDESGVNTLSLQADIGRVPTRRLKKKYVNLNNRLKTLCINYNRQDIPFHPSPTTSSRLNLPLILYVCKYITLYIE